MEPLEKIWHETTHKEIDGKKYILFKTNYDLAFLYASGFVDSNRFTFKQWVEAFEKSKQKDGSYLIDFAQWLQKKKYHYTGPVPPPFDPMTLEEKIYSEKDLLKLLEAKVVPETIFDKDQIKSFLNNLKAQGRLVNGKAKIDQEAKEFMLKFMNTYPSPMRVLRIQVHSLLRGKKEVSKVAQEEVQKSGFAVGQSAQQIAASRLSDLLGSGSGGRAIKTEEKGTVSLKDLQKKRPSGGRV